jgi:hypothetical protein
VCCVCSDGAGGEGGRVAARAGCGQRAAAQDGERAALQAGQEQQGSRGQGQKGGAQEPQDQHRRQQHELRGHLPGGRRRTLAPPVHQPLLLRDEHLIARIKRLTGTSEMTFRFLRDS